jgi:hypothetical protein
MKKKNKIGNQGNDYQDASRNPPLIKNTMTQTRRRIASVLNGEDIPDDIKSIVHSPSDYVSSRKTPSRLMQRLSSRTESGTKKSMVLRHQDHPLNLNNPIASKYVKLSSDKRLSPDRPHTHSLTHIHTDVFNT